jgi:hypothetical protein
LIGSTCEPRITRFSRWRTAIRLVRLPDSLLGRVFKHCKYVRCKRHFLAVFFMCVATSPSNTLQPFSTPDLSVARLSGAGSNIGKYIFFYVMGA